MRKSLMRMTLRQLQVFRSVCEQRSYSRAAEEMSLTQPAVSLQIRQLEELVGQPLFDYVGKKLYLTDAAEALQRAGADIFGRLESLDMQLADLQGSLQGQLSLAVESSAQYFIPHLFAAFRREYPEVSLQLVVVNHAQAIKRLSANRDDLLIMSQVPADMALEFLPFLNNPIIAVAPQAHPLCAREPLSLQELTSWPLLVRETGSGTRKACEEYCHQKRAHFAQTLEVGSLEGQREGVLAGLGLALLPRHAVRRELQEGLLRELPVSELPLLRSWCVVHPRGKHLSPVAQAFFNFVRNQRSQINALAERFAGSLPASSPDN
ncbi:LysR family transcriptional regulator [Pseudomonas taeanensis MS-3]|uniref:LysR family transcriptional regulator n=1 Tax=Pseudomonas taeanensis MS-3 TaxID=1395571 RepID=A0A0A1YM66_9PSED|nr:LysR family transcriptional regulator [Pseudomonas taeanensis]KFX70960.1 LysR family transcriptional regulator [Pseudomonas taeanensis MS-3]